MTSENPQENPGDNAPEKYRLVLTVGGMVLGVVVAYVFGFFSKSPTKPLDLIFWAIGGAVIGFFASMRDPRIKPGA